MTKIYHNPRCRKSRETLHLLEEREEPLTIIEYLVDPPSRGELEEIVQMLGIRPEQLMRKEEEEFKVNYKGKSLTDRECLDAMIRFPKLIQRPIVIKEGRAVIGRPPENVLDIL